MATIESIKAANKAAGLFWFEPETLRFFQSRIGARAHQGPGGIYFVTSERFTSPRGNGPRLFSVRRFHVDGSIDTVGKFQGYKTAKQAASAAATFAVNGHPGVQP
jgi:hypothetical protein